MKRLAAALTLTALLAVPARAESLADFSGLCTGAAQAHGGIDQPQWAGHCRVQATEHELTVTLSAQGPLIEHANALTGVRVLYRDERGLFPPVFFMGTDELCTFLIVPQDPGVTRDLVRYVAEHGNPVDRKARMRVIVEPTEDDTPDSHKLRVRFIPDGPAPWYQAK